MPASCKSNDTVSASQSYCIPLTRLFRSDHLQAMFHVGLTLTIPPDMWDLLKLAIGGYVAGRSVEKAVSAYSSSRTTTPTQASAVQNIFHGGS